jgi:putative endonuclease
MDEVFYVYVLWIASLKRFYTGSTADLDDRLRRHNTGQSKATSAGLPWTLVHSESLATRAAAVRREMFYKTGRGQDELKRRLPELG